MVWGGQHLYPLSTHFFLFAPAPRAKTNMWNIPVLVRLTVPGLDLDQEVLEGEAVGGVVAHDASVCPRRRGGAHARVLHEELADLGGEPDLDALDLVLKVQGVHGRVRARARRNAALAGEREAYARGVGRRCRRPEARVEDAPRSRLLELTARAAVQTARVEVAEVLVARDDAVAREAPVERVVQTQLLAGKLDRRL